MSSSVLPVNLSCSFFVSVARQPGHAAGSPRTVNPRPAQYALDAITKAEGQNASAFTLRLERSHRITRI